MKNQLLNLLPNKIFISDVELEKHAHSDFYLNQKPEAVCYPNSEEDVITVMNFCQKHKVTLIPYGAGTSVEGQVAAIHGGICLDMSQMNRVLEVNVIAGYVTVEPGIAYHELNKQLLPYGLYFPVEAGYGATIGGMTATNASGAGALDAGSMRQNVRCCEVIVYDKNGKAQKLKTGTLASKTSADLDLKSLFVGSEGTLGVITKITLNVRKKLAHTYTIVCQPDDVTHAINLYTTFKDEIRFRRIEWMDALQMKTCLAYEKYAEKAKPFRELVNLEEKNLLLIELGGSKNSLDLEYALLSEALKKANIQTQVYYDEVSAQPIWLMRKHAGSAAIDYLGQGYKKGKATDTAVPLDKLAAYLADCYAHMALMHIHAPTILHLGQANVHFKLLMDVNDLEDKERVEAFDAFITKTALKYGGTCTGEHGIGCGYKQKFLEQEFGPTYIELVQSIKNMLDRNNILNTGKK